ncbi:TRAF3-interacting protein 1, partial [Ophiophagus hannah]
REGERERKREGEKERERERGRERERERKRKREGGRKREGEGRKGGGGRGGWVADGTLPSEFKHRLLRGDAISPPPRGAPHQPGLLPCSTGSLTQEGPSPSGTNGVPPEISGKKRRLEPDLPGVAAAAAS